MTHIKEEFFSMISCEGLIHGNVDMKSLSPLIEDMKSALFSGSRLLPAAFILRNRRIELSRSADVVFQRPIDNINSAIQLLIQLEPLSDTKCGVLGMLFNQIVADHFFDQLRTKEQLGYIVSHRFKEDAGSYSLTFLVQSTRDPSYLYTRIEAFLKSLEVSLRTSAQVFVIFCLDSTGKVIN
jgi:secreted Zn-dependent insulinase-like peptidase